MVEYVVRKILIIYNGPLIERVKIYGKGFKG